MKKSYLLRVAGLATSATVALGLAVPAGAETKAPPRPTPAEQKAEMKHKAETKHDDGIEHKAEMNDEQRAKHEAEMNERMLEFIKHKCEAAIARRLGALKAMQAHVEHAKWVTDAHQAELTKQLDAQWKGLNALKTKIAADTDLDVLLADCRSIVEDYRVYLLMEPKVRLVLAADHMVAMAEKMGKIADNLQERIDAAEKEGRDVSEAQAALDDMNAKLEAATEKAEHAASAVLPLEPQGYPANRQVLIDARKSLREARQDLREAHADAKKWVAELGGPVHEKTKAKSDES